MGGSTAGAAPLRVEYDAAALPPGRAALRADEVLDAEEVELGGAADAASRYMLRQVKRLPAKAAAEWPLLRRDVSRKLAVAWVVNGLVLAAAAGWLLLFVLGTDGGLDLVRSDLFRHAYAVSIAQALLLQDGLKILLITLISPAALPSLFPPDTKRAKRLRRAMRAVYTFLESVL